MLDLTTLKTLHPTNKKGKMATPKTPKPKQGNGATIRITDGRRK